MTAERMSRLPGKIKVVVIPGSDPVGDWVADVVKTNQDMTLVGMVRNLSQALETIERAGPDVIMVDIGSGILQQRELLSHLTAPVSGAAVIVIAMLGEVDMVRQAMLYGAQGFLLKPFSEAELLSSMRQAYDLISQRRAQMADVPQGPAGALEEPVSRAQIVAVYSPKGGVGCTTIAINLAVALRSITSKPATLVDADLRFGDIDTALNITSASSIGTLVSQLDEMDSQLLDRSLISHASGIKVVTAPPHLDMADAIRPEQLKRLLRRLSELDEGYVVVDAWSALDDITLAILDACQHLVIVTTPHVTALRDVHRFLEVLSLLDYEQDKSLLVLNHCYHRSDVKLKDMERALGYPLVQSIEYSPTQVTASLNRGVPLVQEYRDSPAAQNIYRLAELLVQRSAEEDLLAPHDRPAKAQTEKPKKRGLFFKMEPAASGVGL
ncbi:MAG TPA: P-loop NTPase [Anaerolineae bacterium]|nr:P-loop NTPase [Anaerolineae bacterium]